MSATPSSISSIDNDAQLRTDIRVMGSVLGNVIRQHEGSEIFTKVETMRLLAKTWRDKMGSSSDGSGSGQAAADLSDLASFAAQLTTPELYAVARAFTHFLAIANAAEGHHRSRRLKESTTANGDESTSGGGSSGALYPKQDSCGGAIPDLLKQGHTADSIWQALVTQTTELVLTAHPTEVNRRTLLEKKRNIQKILTLADTYRTSETRKTYDLQQLDDAMYREISTIWLSDEVSRSKPTPILEAEKGTLVLETVLWEAVPQFLRKLDVTAKEFLGRGLPLTAAPVRFASWMGGDRYGLTSPTYRIVLSSEDFFLLTLSIYLLLILPAMGIPMSNTTRRGKFVCSIDARLPFYSTRICNVLKVNCPLQPAPKNSEISWVRMLVNHTVL